MTQIAKDIQVHDLMSQSPSPVCYKPKEFCQFLDGTGKEVSICIVNSGVPDHEAILNIAAGANFTSSISERDFVGISTVVSGIVSANKPEVITGIAPDSMLFFAKAIDDKSQVKVDSIVASVLWGIIKNVDIIFVPVRFQHDTNALHDAVTKAYESGICIVAPAGESETQVFPASYDEVLSVGKFGDIDIEHSQLLSTYIDQTYAHVSGQLCSASIVTGMCSVLLEMKASETRRKPKNIYDMLGQCR